MVAVEIREDMGIVMVAPGEAARIEKHFNSVAERAKELEPICQRVFVCFPDRATAKLFRNMYTARIGPLSEQDFDNDNEVILKFHL